MRINKIKPLCSSFIGWVGGKTKLCPTILACFPKHDCFVEVFSGSAIVFFGKAPSKREIVNDIHGELSHLMEVIAGVQGEDIRQQFIQYVRDMPASRSTYNKWSKDGNSSIPPALRAFKFYYCVKKGFNSHPKGGYEASPVKGSRYNQKTDFEPFAKRFRETNAQIENLDFRDLIPKYNREIADSFFFMDPPYFIANESNYYDYSFEEEDHLDLKKCCDDITKNDNKFLITYDDCKEAIELYNEYFIYRTDPIVYNTPDNRETRDTAKTELFITNYDLHKMFYKRRNKDIFSPVSGNDSIIEVGGGYNLERII